MPLILVQKDAGNLMPVNATAAQRTAFMRDYAIYDVNADNSLAGPYGPMVPSAALNLPFSPTITFATVGVMQTQTVSSVIAFTAAVSQQAAVTRGGVPEVSVDLIADGTNAPTFTGFREWDGSSGYQNIIGLRNTITFFYRAGVAYYSVNQRLSLAPEPDYPLAQVVRFASLFNFTESGAALTGWNYAATNAGFMQNTAVAALAFPASGDAEVAHTISSVASGDMAILIDATLGNANVYTACRYGIWVASGGNAVSTENNTFPVVATAGQFINGDIVRISRVGSTMTAYKSRAGVLTTLKTWTGVPTGRLYIGLSGSGVGAASQNPRGTNLA